MEHLTEDLRSYIAGLRRYAISLVGNSVEADDLVQETLQRGLQSLNKGRKIDNLRGYLFTILHNVRISQIRRSGNGRDHVPIEDMTEELSCTGNQHHAMELKQLLAAVNALPMEQRSVILLVCVEGFTYRETADALGVPIGTVMSRLSRARKVLINRFEVGDRPRLAEIKQR